MELISIIKFLQRIYVKTGFFNTTIQSLLYSALATLKVCLMMVNPYTILLSVPKDMREAYSNICILTIQTYLFDIL